MTVRMLVFIFLTALSSGCKKDELTFTLTGTISDKTYNSAQNAGTVKVYKVPVVGQGTSNELVGQTQPDAQGKYSITFPREKAEAYVISYTRNSYFDEDFTIPFSAWSTEKDYVLNFSTETISTVRWLIQKTTPSSVNGEVKIFKQSGRTKGEFCCANEAYTYTGFEVNDTLTCASGGGSYVRYQVVNLSMGIYYTDSIYCPPTGIGEAVVNF